MARHRRDHRRSPPAPPPEATAQGSPCDAGPETRDLIVEFMLLRALARLGYPGAPHPEDQRVPSASLRSRAGLRRLRVSHRRS